jgi:hypothetical protein
LGTEVKPVRKGFVPLPIILRKLMRHLTAPEFRVLVYLHLRASKFGICYPTQEEMAFELGLQGTKNLAPYVRKLEAKKLISTRTALGRKFYLIHDPRVCLLHMAQNGQLTNEEIDEIDHLYIDLGQATIRDFVTAQKPEEIPTVNTAQLSTHRRIILG